ncbi:MAG TPA: patatin-like phospholipase family protein, partial [Polyangiaceae bacterium]|nr:patatin-like phospholipase family protein [Polyangiaceae bacterium]
MRHQRRSAGSVVCLAACLTLTACFHNKNAFIELAYPQTEPEPPKARDWVASVDAAVVPALLGGYTRPWEVGACLASVAADPRATPALAAFGNCSADGHPLPVCLAALPWARPTGAEPKYTLELGCPTPPTLVEDRIALTLALGRAGEELVSYRRRAFGPHVSTTLLEPELAQALTLTLEHAARVLRADVVAHDLRQPVLSLGGGAANGAFVAGYLHALLWQREQAFLHAPAAIIPLLERERFGGVVGTSVGSLISLPLDLYFSDVTPSMQERQAFLACAAGAPSPSSGSRERAQQRCALERLRHTFAVNEWELLCAEPGLAPKPWHEPSKNVVRFDPLEGRILKPFIAEFGRLLAHDSFIRVAVVTDLAQSTTLGLDERACLGLGANESQCAVSAVLASLSEPLLARPVTRVYSGLRGSNGEQGAFLDGGRSSVNPTRAIALNRSRVLALNPSRAHGTPGTLSEGLSPYSASRALTSATGRGDLEQRYAAVDQERRRRLRCELGELIGDVSSCDGSSVAGFLSLSVPEDIEPKSLLASGYTFDPLVMRGLFLWGEKTFFRSRKQVLKFLEFCSIAALEDPTRVCP